MKTYKQFINEIAGSRPLDDISMGPKNDLLKLEEISDKIKIINLKPVPLSGWMGKISIDDIEYEFDVYDNLGDWEYFIFDFPGSDVGTFPYDDRRGLQGDIEDIKDELEHYLGVK